MHARAITLPGLLGFALGAEQKPCEAGSCQGEQPSQVLRAGPHPDSMMAAIWLLVIVLCK